ncbi:MAG TPA: M20/M25/M40 family metallo-hydrolase [Gaiellaceae bacterium]|nr:M20/M25/M40 family metallo-hydrolase [Gaiellaceae bacterium]
MAATWTSGVFELFVELAAIPSPSGEEEAVAAVIRRYLADLGLEVEGDEAGNLLARIEPAAANGGAPIFLCAHMDTVPPVGPIEPVVGEDGFVRNGAGTILGADNKATVAVLLEAARLVLSEGRPHAGVELLFTVGEEVGLQGAKAFDHTRLQARLGFVYDCSGPIGGVVRSAPFGKTIDVTFKGRCAHAGLQPEEGRSAVAAAARAIADLRLGRIDEETTANVGVIEGGTARNVVPELCTLAAEARSRDEGKLAELVQEMLDAFSYAAGVAECEVETRISETYPGYRFRPDDEVFALAGSALRRAGLEPTPIDVGGGSDANVFNVRGLPCANLANGMTQVHTPDERIAVSDLDTMLGVTLELVDAARLA